MKKPFKILPLIFGMGLIISFILLFTGTGGSGIGDFLDAIVYLSIILFTASILVLILDFKNVKSTISIWLFIILSTPLTFLYAYNLSFDKLVTSTTPTEYLNNNVDQTNYSNDSLQLTEQVDSLISKQIVYKYGEKAERYFDDKFYNDTISRHWAIDLNLKNNTIYRTIIDTLFYSPLDTTLLAGLLINERFNEYLNNPDNPKKIDFTGTGFVAHKLKNGYEIFILKYRTSNEDLIRCSDFLFQLYCRKTNFEKEGYNMNDIRFWKGNDWKGKFKE